MTERGRRVTIGRMTGRFRAMWRSAAVSAAFFAALVGWEMLWDLGRSLTDVVVTDLAIAAAAFLLGWRRTWVDPDAGAIGRTTGGVLTRTVHWSEAFSIYISSRRGWLELRVSGEQATIIVPLLRVGRWDGHSLEPDQLRLLADEIERWAPERGVVATVLRSQAQHVEALGEVHESPLAQQL